MVVFFLRTLADFDTEPALGIAAKSPAEGNAQNHRLIANERQGRTSEQAFLFGDFGIRNFFDGKALRA